MVSLHPRLPPGSSAQGVRGSAWEGHSGTTEEAQPSGAAGVLRVQPGCSFPAVL